MEHDLRKLSDEQLKLMKPRIYIPSSFDKFRIWDPSFLEEGDGRTRCGGCGHSRRYFCYTCYTPLDQFKDRTPQVQLPCKVDLLKHPREIAGKSTAVHAPILAPHQATLYTYPHIPDYRATSDKVILIFPGPDAARLEDLFSSAKSSHKDADNSNPADDGGANSSTCTDGSPASKLPFDRVVLVDCTWNQVKRIILDERVKGLPRVELSSHVTLFWRYQTGKPNTYLATIEALYYFLLDLHRITCHGADAASRGTPVGGPLVRGPSDGDSDVDRDPIIERGICFDRHLNIDRDSGGDSGVSVEKKQVFDKDLGVDIDLNLDGGPGHGGDPGVYKDSCADNDTSVDEAAECVDNEEEINYKRAIDCSRDREDLCENAKDVGKDLQYVDEGPECKNNRTGGINKRETTEVRRSDVHDTKMSRGNGCSYEIEDDLLKGKDFEEKLNLSRVTTTSIPSSFLTDDIPDAKSSGEPSSNEIVSSNTQRDLPQSTSEVSSVGLTSTSGNVSAVNGHADPISFDDFLIWDDSFISDCQRDHTAGHTVPKPLHGKPLKPCRASQQSSKKKESHKVKDLLTEMDEESLYIGECCHQYDNLLFFFKFMFFKIHDLYDSNNLRAYK